MVGEEEKTLTANVVDAAKELHGFIENQGLNPAEDIRQTASYSALNTALDALDKLYKEGVPKGRGLN